MGAVSTAAGIPMMLLTRAYYPALYEDGVPVAVAAGFMAGFFLTLVGFAALANAFFQRLRLRDRT